MYRDVCADLVLDTPSETTWLLELTHTDLSYISFFYLIYILKMSRIDIILPCYNPHHSWIDKVIISSHSIRKKLKGDDLNIVLVNDGSVKGITKSDVAMRSEER